jgi:hypothetical protein
MRTARWFGLLVSMWGGLAAAAGAPQPQPATPPVIPSNDAIRTFLAHRLQDNAVGVVIGIIEPAGRRIIT